ncbi:hypothetical protein TNCV_2081691 [Trichonephila clavipes]|nr:hypothetical protein TNCV_2081691 [Trichonephila clavipes]
MELVPGPDEIGNVIERSCRSCSVSSSSIIDGYSSRKRKGRRAKFQAKMCVFLDDVPLAKVGNHMLKMVPNCRRSSVPVNSLGIWTRVDGNELGVVYWEKPQPLRRYESFIWEPKRTLEVLAASTARFFQFQRYAATLCQFLIFRVFKSFSTSSIHLVGGLPLVRDSIGFLNVGSMSGSGTESGLRVEELIPSKWYCRQVDQSRPPKSKTPAQDH